MDSGDVIYLVVLALCGYWITGAFLEDHRKRKEGQAPKDDSSGEPPCD
jgi:hypothetical protein